MPFSLKRGAWLLVVNAALFVFILALIEVGLRVSQRIQIWTTKPVMGVNVPGSLPIDDFWGATPRSVVIHRGSSIPGLAYEMAPNRELRAGDGTLIKTNQFGMRDYEPAAQDSDSPCRIVVLGDSYTFGLGVREEEAYPKVLEKLLRQSPEAAQCQFEVLNFGVVGYSSHDEDLVLKYRAVNFHPRVVMIGYVLNDPELGRVENLHRYFTKRAWWQHFRLLRLAVEAKDNWDIKRLGGGDYYVYLHAPGRREWQSVVDAFSDIRDVTSRRNIKVLVVIFPELTESFKGKPWKDYPYTKIHRQVSDLAIRNGFRVVDLLDAFSQYPSRDVVFQAADDHPSVLGHEVAARAIEKELLAESSYFFGFQ